MRKLLLLLIVVISLLAGAGAGAQTTTVTGTVADANGNPYFPGTVSAYIILNTGQALPPGVPASGSIGPFSTVAGGNFSIPVPSPFLWQFTICGVPTNIGPRANPVPTQVCFSTTAIPISGVSQVITGSLPLPIPLLGPGGGGGGSLTSPVTSPNPLAFDVDLAFKGPNPYLDITRFGARAVSGVPATPGITASCTNGLPNVTLSSASTFQNGDGVVLYGCGSSTVNVPAAPVIRSIVAASQTGTLLGVTAPAGATTYCYQLLSRTFMGGTAPSTETCTATGPASLGLQSVSITSVSLTNNQATYTTSSAHGLVAGALVVTTGVTTTEFGGANNSAFNGWFTVASTADNTHFVVNLMVDTRNGAVSAGTGGTVNYWNGIEVKGAETTNNYQYYVYGRVTGGTKTLIGAMLPQNHTLTIGPFADPVYLLWDDFGPTVSTFPLPPYYIPTTVPVGSTNDMLATTIFSGAGTTFLVLNTNASNTIAGQTILQDSAQGFLAAIVAARSGGGWVRIPSTSGSSFIFNSPVLVTGGGASPVIQQDGGISVFEPVEFTIQAKWKQGTPSFAFNPGFSQQVQTSINCLRASPCIYALTNFYLSDLAMVEQSSGGSVMYLQDGGGIPTSTFTNVSWIGYTGGNSYSNISAIFRGNGADMRFTNITLTSSQNANFVAVTPGLWFNQPPNIYFDGIYLSGVGVAIYPNLQGAGAYFSAHGVVYCQGCYMPKFSILNAVGPVWASVGEDISDTQFNSPTIANYAGSKLVVNGFAVGNTITGNGGSSSGPSIGQQITNLDLGGEGLYFQGFLSPPGRTGVSSHNTPLVVHDGNFANIVMGLDFLDRSTGVGQGYSLFTTTASPAAPTCSTPAGGTLNSGTFLVYYSPVFLGNGSEGSPSRSCTVTTAPGNQTITATVPSPIGGVNNQYAWYVGPPGPPTVPFCGVSTNSITVSSGIGGVPCGGLGLGNGPVNPSGGPAGMRGSSSWTQTEQIGLTSVTSSATVPRSVTLPDVAGALQIGAAGSTTQVQFNNAGAFAGDPFFTWLSQNTLNANLKVGGATAQGNGGNGLVLFLQNFAGGGGGVQPLASNGAFAVLNSGGSTSFAIGGAGDINGSVLQVKSAAQNGVANASGVVGYDTTTSTLAVNNSNGVGNTAWTGAWNCTNVTPVTVNANVTTDQNLMTCTVPAGTLNRVGRSIRVWLSGVYSTPAASVTAVVVKVNLGALNMATWTSTALGGVQATNDQFNVSANFTTQTGGATAVFENHGNLVIDLGVGNAVADTVFADVNAATVGNVNSTAAQTLQVTIAFTVASASNSATQRQLIVETIN